MNKFLRFGLIGLLVIGLALIRYFEHDLFADPLLEFYSSDFSFSDAPEFKTFQVIATTSWRYTLNTILSLGIIWLAFPSRKTLFFSLFFYAFAYVVLITIFWMFISDMQREHYLLIFYVRRFLIQPIFVLILLPAFYYQKNTIKRK